MPSLINQADTSNLDSDRVLFDISDVLNRLQTEEGPLSVLTRQSNSQKTDKPEYKHFESDLRNPEIATSGSETASATTLDLASDDASQVHVDMLVYNTDTDEVMVVTDVDTGADTIDVSRGHGSSSAAAIDSSDVLVLFGPALSEGSSAPTEVSATTDKVNNYTQIFRHVFSVTGTLSETIMEAGNPEFDRLQADKALEHIRDIEWSYMFGVKNEDLSGSTPQRTTGGLLEHITTNTLDLGGSELVEGDLDTIARDVFQYGRSEKWLLAGGHLMEDINGFARDDLQMVPEDDTFGIRVSRYKTSYGDLNITYHPLLQRRGRGNMGFIIDVDSIGERFLSSNRNEVLRMNIQNNDEDVVKAEFLSEKGFEVFNEEKCGIIDNVATS